MALIYSDNYFDLPRFGSITYDYQKNFDGINNVDVLGQVLYNYFTPCFLVAGLLLLVAMLSAIVCINIKFLR